MRACVCACMRACVCVCVCVCGYVETGVYFGMPLTGVLNAEVAHSMCLICGLRAHLKTTIIIMLLQTVRILI